ncbi:hypothetical protein [Nonomuraea recticatena]|uniref:hypothetical protein n=1 Tax=Nonomuraea recticatena TaxID=46178 RepID=UPI003617C5C4
MRLRNVRWNVQWWAAIGTVLAGLMSVPALVISTNALRISEQQRIDALTQRTEDQKERTRAKVAEEEDRKAAFAMRVVMWNNLPGDTVHSLNDLQNVTIRNGNAQQAIVVIRMTSDTTSEEGRFLIPVPPCSQVALRDPAKPEGEDSEYFVVNTLDKGKLWPRFGHDSEAPRGTFEDFIAAGSFGLISPTNSINVTPCT